MLRPVSHGTLRAGRGHGAVSLPGAGDLMIHKWGFDVTSALGDVYVRRLLLLRSRYRGRDSVVRDVFDAGGLVGRMSRVSIIDRPFHVARQISQKWYLAIVATIQLRGLMSSHAGVSSVRRTAAGLVVPGRVGVDRPAEFDVVGIDDELPIGDDDGEAVHPRGVGPAFFSPTRLYFDP